MPSVGVLKFFDPVTDDIEIWVLTFRSYLTANAIDSSKNEERCRAILLSTLGMNTMQLLVSLIAPDKPDTKSLDDLIHILEHHFKPSPKAIAERFKFMGRRQKQGETVSQYLAELRNLAATCKFNDLDNRLRDQFIFGILSESAQKKLFTKSDDIKLKDVIAVAHAEELSEISTSIIRARSQPTTSSSMEQVNKVQMKKSQWQKSEHQGNKFKNSQKGNGHSSSKSCPNCGSSSHASSKDCPHKDVTCHSCGKKGHFSKLCRSKGNSNGNQSSSKAAATSYVEIRTVESTHSVEETISKKKIWINVEINGIPHSMEFDTGCERSILSEDFWSHHLQSKKLKKSSVTFKTYTDQLFSPIGELLCNIDYPYLNQSIQHSIPVSKGTSLFGRDLVRKLKLDWKSIASQCNKVKTNSEEVSLSIESLLHEYEDIFSEPKGHIKGFKAKILLKDDATPKFLKARPIPYALLPKVDKELIEMESLGVIERIDHSDWASPLVVVPKPNGKIRITGDFKNTVNSQLNITQYPIQCPEQLFISVSGGEKFSKLDGRNAYHQLELEESCKKFLVINTHRGLYRYKVLPQGVSSSPAIFQEFADKLLQGVPQSGSYIDDVLCSAANDQEHLSRLKSIFQRMRESNYYLSKDKCQFMQDHVSFLGHILSKHGIHTDPKKIEDIVTIQAPENVSELKSFIGLINFYGKFVKAFADICEPLYRLTRSDEPWSWTKQCQDAFEKVKKALTSSEVLVHFDPSKPIGISCDASQKGLGIVLYHQFGEGKQVIERPIAYASRIMSDTEQRYSQIEREGLSIIYGLQKFYKFLCGRKFILITDHQPLLAIFGPKTSLQAYVAARLHRWSLYLSQFQYTIQYRRTTDHGNADALSRLPSQSCPEIIDEAYEVKFIASEQVDALPVNFKTIRKATATDKCLSKVLICVQSRWPNEQKDDQMKPFFIRQNELSIEQGVLMWGIRVVIPATLRPKILQDLHESHFGIVKMKSLARQFVWWPNIDSDIEHLGKSCTECCQSRPDPPSAPLHPWQYPERPWQRLHIDLAGPFLNRMWLVIMDASTKWPEVFDINNNSTSSHVIMKIRETLTRFGLPDQIVSDNGPQFTSEEFQRFCANNGIRHTTSSVYHPRSNGEAERFVQTFKQSMKKSKGDVSLRLQCFLFHYRLTPHSTTGSAPSELLMGRRPRSLLDLIRPDVHLAVAQSQDRQVASFNKSTRSRYFEEGEDVWVKTHFKNEKKWTLGKIIKSLGPVTYLVSINGSPIKRHVDHIYPAQKLEFDLAKSPTPQPSPYKTAPESTTIIDEPVNEDASSSNTTLDTSGQRPKRVIKPIDRLGI